MKIGVGIITCNRQDYLTNLLTSIYPCEDINELVIVNDGSPIDNIDFNKPYSYILNDNNLGIAKSKNKAMKHLLDSGCDYIFIIEDDTVIKDTDIFNAYINASKVTGIQHFNFGPGTPFNRKQKITNFDLNNRHLLDNESTPNPKITIDYSILKIDLYEHIAGVFSFFTKEILHIVGLNDERFYNAWEHVEHTYRIIKAKGHPPFWWFADIHNSVKYLEVPSEAITNSSTSNNKEDWYKNIHKGRELYKEIHNFYPNMTPNTLKEDVLINLKQIKQIC